MRSSDLPSSTSDTASRISALTRITPVHSLPKRERVRLRAAVVRGPGRPRKIEVAPTAPTNDERDYNAMIDEQRQVWIQVDPVAKSQAACEDDGANRLRVIERALAEEAACLLFNRREAERRGTDGSTIASRRIDALCKLSATIRGRVAFFEPEISGQRLARVAKLWLEQIRETAEATMGPTDMATVFLERVTAAMKEWSSGTAT
jgi:hypothetical protein